MVLQGRAPELANLVNITPITRVYGGYIYILVGGLEHLFFVHILGSS